MSKKRNGVSRREFIRDAALLSGSLAAVGLPGVARGQGTAAPPKLGAQLIGKLEGPELILDPAKWPTKFSEAPMLAELVKQGKLPPVEQRVPKEPLVIKPVHEIGRYGGTWRRGFTGPGDGENGNRIVSADKLLFWDYTGTKIMPVRRAPVAAERRRQVGHPLPPQGHKWSDGKPFTADDFVFWYEDIYLNKDLVPTPHPDFMINGKSGVIKKIDETTVLFEFPEPNYLFVDILAGTTAMGGGQALWQMRGPDDGRLHAGPLPQAVPAEVRRHGRGEREGEGGRTSTAGSAYIKNRWDWRLNPELPVLTPWKTVTPINTPTWVMERNPFYYEVDTAGNQLPYIDRIQMTLAENLEVLNLRAIAGQYDLQERHTAMAKLPVFLENRDKVGYDVRLDPALNGSDATLQINHAYEADPEIAKWLHTADFRRALSMGIDRDQLNETFWLGIGTPGSVAPAESHALQPGPGVAEEVVDARRQAGQRAARQDRPRRRRTARATGCGPTARGGSASSSMTSAGAFIPHTQIAEMIKEQWKKIGIQADVKEMERSLFFTRVRATSTRSPSGRTTAPSCSTSSRGTRFPWIRRESLMGTPDRALVRLAAASRGRRPRTRSS